MSEDHGGAARVWHLLQVGRLAEARAHLSVLLASAPSDPELHQLMAMTYLDEDDGRNAVEWAAEAIALAPDDPVGHLVLSHAELQAGRAKAAASAAHRAVLLAPHDADGYRALASALSRVRGRGADARSVASHALELEPDNPESHFTLGYVFHGRSRSKAAAHYRRCLLLDPHHTAAHNNLSALGSRRAPVLAIHEFSGILASEPDYRPARHNLESAINWLAYLIFMVPLALFYLILKVNPEAPGWVLLLPFTGWLGGGVWMWRRLPAGARTLAAPTVTPTFYRHWGVTKWLAVGAVALVGLMLLSAMRTGAI